MDELLIFGFGFFSCLAVAGCWQKYDEGCQRKKQKAKDESDYILNKIGYVKNDVIHLEDRVKRLVEKFNDLDERLQKLERQEKNK